MKGRTEPGRLDSYYWTLANTGRDCAKGSDGDNGFICEKEPEVDLP